VSKHIGLIAMTVVVMALALAWTVLQWNECRDAGFSVMYCWQHIS
jgi:hypothetical protein